MDMSSSWRCQIKARPTRCIDCHPDARSVVAQSSGGWCEVLITADGLMSYVASGGDMERKGVEGMILDLGAGLVYVLRQPLGIASFTTGCVQFSQRMDRVLGEQHEKKNYCLISCILPDRRSHASVPRYECTC